LRWFPDEMVEADGRTLELSGFEVKATEHL
jgi:hypothetical protein